MKFEATMGLLLWLVALVLLVDALAHLRLSELLEKSLKFVSPDDGKLPYWVLVAVIYVGARVLVKVFGLGMPRAIKQLLLRIPHVCDWDDSANADRLFAHSNLRASQGTRRFVTNFLLWVCILTVKFLFDFFLVVRPVAAGPFAFIVQGVNKDTPMGLTGAKWSDVVTAVVVCFGLFFSTGLLVLYNTGLFFQMFSSIYSVLFLAVPKRVGLVK